MGGNLGADGERMLHYFGLPNFTKLFEEKEYVRRLINQTRHTWEGMSWIIDLLPRYPAQAIEAISAYDLAHFFILPDGRVHGLADAVDIIRAKYLEAITEENLASTVSPIDFEYLVAAYYSYVGYNVRVTRQTRDGGHDIIASRESNSGTERLLVECKCSTVPIPVTTIRQLGGVLAEFTATGGVLVTTSRFTVPGYQYAKRTARIQLIDHGELCRRLNSAFGPSWTLDVARIVRQGKLAAASDHKRSQTAR
jgi:restriction system protein